MSLYFLVKDLLSRPFLGRGLRLLLLPLTVLAWLYGRLLALRRWGYRRGVFRSFDAGVPVISVGNVTAGGTGKTPCVEAVCRVLLKAGVRPAVLSRGYGREGGGRGCLVVSAGDGPLVDAREGGDEPVFLAARLRGVPVLVGRDRRVTARDAVARHGAQALVLDDGFQHLRLRRDLDIVAIDVTNPVGNGSTLPRGLLREPLDALADADLLLLTRAGRMDPKWLAGVRRMLQTHNSGSPILATSHAAVRLTDQSGERRPIEALSDLKVLAFAGIANTASFFQELQALGARVLEAIPFPDHHVYTAADLRKIQEWAGLMNAQAVVTTEKDGVRLAAFRPFSVDLLTLGVELRFLEGEEIFREMVLTCLRRDRNPARRPRAGPRR